MVARKKRCKVHGKRYTISVEGTVFRNRKGKYLANYKCQRCGTVITKKFRGVSPGGGLQ